MLLIFALTFIVQLAQRASFANSADNGYKLQSPAPPSSVPTATTFSRSGPFDIDPATFRRIVASTKLSQQGASDLKNGDWQKAEDGFRQALALLPDNDEATYGLAQCADHAGDTATAVAYYRRNIYTSDPPRYGTVLGDEFKENSVDRLMQFALLLNKAGQVDESVSIFNHAIVLFNYGAEGHRLPPVTLPAIGSRIGDTPYTPQRLKALADIALSWDEFDHKVQLQELQEATQLAPDMAVTWLYLGRYHYGRNLPGSPEIFHQAMQKVLQLDNGDAAAQAREWLKNEP